jgi:hypothetical protein
VEDKNKYNNGPGWGIGTAPREFGAKPKYDHYENDGFLVRPFITIRMTLSMLIMRGNPNVVRLR